MQNTSPLKRENREGIFKDKRSRKGKKRWLVPHNPKRKEYYIYLRRDDERKQNSSHNEKDKMHFEYLSLCHYVRFFTLSHPHLFICLPFYLLVSHPFVCQTRTTGRWLVRRNTTPRSGSNACRQSHKGVFTQISYSFQRVYQDR